MNRQQLKKHRKSASELLSRYPLRKKLNLHQQKIDPEIQKAFLEELMEKRKRERRRALVIAVVLVVLGIFMISFMFI